MLSDEELDRYARHLVLREVGGIGQAKIRAARVLMVGVGGLGSPCALYLAAAGVGTIGLVDDDHVSLSNLQRQILFRSADVGRGKVEAGAAALEALNPGVRVSLHPVRLTPDNAAALVADYDIVADGSDNFATRFLLNLKASWRLTRAGCRTVPAIAACFPPPRRRAPCPPAPRPGCWGRLPG